MIRSASSILLYLPSWRLGPKKEEMNGPSEQLAARLVPSSRSYKLRGTFERLGMLTLHEAHLDKWGNDSVPGSKLAGLLSRALN